MQTWQAKTLGRVYSLPAILVVFGAPAMGGFLFGFDISITSYAILQLTRIYSSSIMIGLIVSAPSIGACLGSIHIFLIADPIDRRAELRYAAALYILGAFAEVLTGFINVFTASFFILMTGRLIYGVGIAYAMHAGPTYIAEMVPSQIRGFLVSLKEAVIVFGILCGYLVGYTLEKFEYGWFYSYGSSLLASSTMLFLSFTIPQSCRWLLLQGEEEAALQSLCFIYIDEQHAKQELDAILHQTHAAISQANEKPLSLDTEPLLSNFPPSFYSSIWDIRYRSSMMAGMGLVILQQITGQPSVLSYATPIFANAGLSDWSSILVAFFKLCATMVSASLVENFGRKNLLYLGNTLMLIALLVLSLSLGTSILPLNTIIIFAMFAYVGGYQVSFGPISWLMISECFPLFIRGQAVAVAVQCNFFFNAVVQFAVPLLERVVGLNILFAFFALLTAYSIYFVSANVPETKGLTLEQIEQQFAFMQSPRKSVTAATHPNHGV